MLRRWLADRLRTYKEARYRKAFARGVLWAITELKNGTDPESIRAMMYEIDDAFDQGAEAFLCMYERVHLEGTAQNNT